MTVVPPAGYWVVMTPSVPRVTTIPSAWVVVTEPSALVTSVELPVVAVLVEKLVSYEYPAPVAVVLAGSIAPPGSSATTVPSRKIFLMD